MHSRTKSTSSLTSSPRKRMSLGRAQSNGSSNSGTNPGCLPVGTTTKETHATTNAFYAQMLEAQKKKDAKLEAKLRGEKPQNVERAARRSRAVSEEPITALPMLSPEPMDFPEPPVSKTPKKKCTTGLMLIPPNAAEAIPTQRAAIEARKEKKIMEMLTREVPMSPPAVTFEEAPMTMTYDSTNSITRKTGVSTSPKKKFLGINISVPSFMAGGSDATELPTSSTIPPPSPPPPPPALKRRSTVKEPKQEEPTSHLPNKVRQLKNLYDKEPLIDDSPTCGRYGLFPAPRSVSDGVTAALHRKVSNTSMNSAGSVHQSKAMPSVREADIETIPPTPPAKNTPPKIIIQQRTPSKQHQNVLVAKTEAVAEPTPVKGVQHLRSGYLDLLQKAPSMYSLHGDIQHLPGSQSAGLLDCSMPKDNDQDGEILQPKVYEGRWSEGQLPTRRRQCDIEHVPSSPPPPPQPSRPLRGPIAPVFYSPSVYSVAWSPEGTGRQQTHPVSFYQPPPSKRPPPRSIYPSTDSGQTVPFKANAEDVFGSAVEQASPEPEQADKDLDATMLIQSREDLLPSRELAGDASGNVIMPANPGEIETRKSTSEKTSNGRLSGRNDQAKDGSVESDASGRDGPRDSVSTSDYYPPDVPQYPAAMPTPLFGRNQHGFNMPLSPPPGFSAALPTPASSYTSPMWMHAPGAPGLVMMPDRSNILTHFDVLNRHIMDVANSLHSVYASTSEQIAGQMSKTQNESKAVSDSHAKQVEHNFGNLKHKIDASNSTLEAFQAETDKQLGQVRDDLDSKFSQLTNQMSEILERFTLMQTQIDELHKKSDHNRSSVSSEIARAVQSTLSAYCTTGPSMQSQMLQPMPSQFMYYDSQGRMMAPNASQATQMQTTGQPMYPTTAVFSSKEERNRSDEWNHNRNGPGNYGGAGDGYGMRGYHTGSR